MSKLIRISDDAYDFIKSLDGKITDNVDQIIRSFESIKNKPIVPKRNRGFNASRILSLALLIEIIKIKLKKADQMYYYRKNFLDNCFNQLKEWKKDFPKFFDPDNKTIFTRSLDYNLLRYMDKGIITKQKMPKILQIWIENTDANKPKKIDHEVIERLFAKVFNKNVTNYNSSNSSIRYNNRSIYPDLIVGGTKGSADGDPFIIEIKTGKPTIQIIGASRRHSQNFSQFREMKDELLKYPRVKNLDDGRIYSANLFEYKTSTGNSYKFRMTYDVIEPSYEINENLIMEENSIEIFEEILRYSNKKIMKDTEYFPSIFAHFYKSKKESKIVLLINHIKLNYLMNNLNSKKISSDQKKIINNEINALLESKNYKEEQEIRESDKWYVA